MITKALLITLISIPTFLVSAYATEFLTEGRKIERISEQEDANSQYERGLAYKNGKGVFKDETEAVRWYRKAAEQGHAKAQNALGLAYKWAQGVAIDYVEAAKWFEKSAEQGNSAAQYNLGFAYEMGQGRATNLLEAMNWYRKSADQGYAHAQNSLGLFYMNGLGIPKNRPAAIELFRKSTAQGNQGGKTNLQMAESIWVKTERVKIPAVIDGKTFILDGMLYTPEVPSPRPAMIMTGGRNQTGPQDGDKNLYQFGYNANIALAQRGMVVLNLVRRGYGASDGPDTELKLGAEDTGMEMVKDLAAGVRYLRELIQVDKDRIILAGQSQGGWAAATAASVPIEGVVGTVSFAAAVVTIEGDGPYKRRLKMGADLKHIGKKAVVPCLFIYAANDMHTTESDARLFFASFIEGGGKGALALYPPTAGEGHYILSNGIDVWMPDLTTFLSSVGIELLKPSI